MPVPQVRDLEELNAQLRRRSAGRIWSGGCGARRPRKASLLAEDQAAFLPLPAAPFDACRKAVDDGQFAVAGALRRQRLLGAGALRASSRGGEGLRRPGGDCAIKDSGSPATRGCGARRSVCFEPVHYLALLERKPGRPGPCPAAGGLGAAGVLRRAAPPAGGPKRDGEGTREYIRVLRLLEKHSLPALDTGGRSKALRSGALTPRCRSPSS